MTYTQQQSERMHEALKQVWSAMQNGTLSSGDANDLKDNVMLIMAVQSALIIADPKMRGDHSGKVSEGFKR